MRSTEETRRLSCYAVLKSGYTGNNYLIPHMRLVLCLISTKHYLNVEIQTLIEDFPCVFHYDINFFAMRKILSLAVEQGYVTKKHNDRRYHPTERIHEFSSVDEDILCNESRLAKLVKSFQEYAHLQGVEYSEARASEIIIAYVKSQKLEHITRHISSVSDDKRIDYLVGRFIFHIRDSNVEMFDFLNTVVMGSILTDCLTFHEELNNGKHLEELTIVFDTAVVFMALGIDVAQRGEYYVNLIKDLQSKGTKTVMFRHSYDEMQFILVGASDWVQSLSYDPAKASETTEYFRSLGASPEDVKEYSLTLKSRIEEMGIVIIDPDYQESLYTNVECEKSIYKRIINKYKQTNPLFEEEQNRSTIERDVKSISKIYLLRNGANAVHLSECKYLFVTANQTLSQVAAEYHRDSGKAESTMPSTITDTFLGTYLWLNDPIKVSEMNEKQILSHAFLAFQPNEQLLKKLSHTVDGLLAAGEITPDICYALKSNPLVWEKLSQKTLGDPDAYREETPLHIFKEIQAEAEQKGVMAERKRNELREKEQEERHRNELSQSQKRNEMLRSLMLENLTRDLNDTQRESEELDDRSQKIDDSIKKLNVVLIVMAVCFVLAICGGIVGLAVQNEIIISIISLVAPLLLWIYGCLTCRKINPKTLIDTICSNQAECKRIKAKCTLKQKQDLAKRGQELQRQIEVYSSHESLSA